MKMTEFLEKVKSYAYLVTEDGFLTNPEKLQKDEKRIVPDFVVDKRSLKICRSTKDTVIISSGGQTSEGHKKERIFVWDVLLPTPANYEAATSEFFHS